MHVPQAQVFFLIKLAFSLPLFNNSQLPSTPFIKATCRSIISDLGMLPYGESDQITRPIPLMGNQYPGHCGI